MAIYGYARASTLERDIASQEAALRRAGCGVVHSEKAGDASKSELSELASLRQFLQAGDILMVTRIDRLARSIKDLQEILQQLRAAGVTLKTTEQPIDTATSSGKTFLEMLSVFAEFETTLRKERQMEGIAHAKANGVYTGRKPTIDPVEIRRLRDEEKLSPTAIARHLGIARASVYRLLTTSEN